MSADKPGLSIFFPAYNDAGTIASLALVAHMTARTLTDDYEVIATATDGEEAHLRFGVCEPLTTLPFGLAGFLAGHTGNCSRSLPGCRC